MRKTALLFGVLALGGCAKKAPIVALDAGISSAGPAVAVATPGIDAGPPLPIIGELASLPASPGAGHPTKATAVHDASRHDESTVYDYALPGCGAAQLEVLKDRPVEWLWTLSVNATAPQFSPTGSASVLFSSSVGAVHSTWSEVEDGPLAGAFVGQMDGSDLVTIASPSWAQNQAEPGISDWFRKHQRAPPTR